MYLHTITAADIGRPVIHVGERRLWVDSFLGAVLPGDVGKRIFEVDGIIQVESNEQRDRRVAEEGEVMAENVVGAHGATVSILLEPDRPQLRRQRIVLLDENGSNVILDLDSAERRKLVEVLEELGTEVW